MHAKLRAESAVQVQPTRRRDGRAVVLTGDIRDDPRDFMSPMIEHLEELDLRGLAGRVCGVSSRDALPSGWRNEPRDSQPNSERVFTRLSAEPRDGARERDSEDALPASVDRGVEQLELGGRFIGIRPFALDGDRVLESDLGWLTGRGDDELVLLEVANLAKSVEIKPPCLERLDRAEPIRDLGGEVLVALPVVPALFSHGSWEGDVDLRARSGELPGGVNRQSGQGVSQVLHDVVRSHLPKLDGWHWHVHNEFHRQSIVAHDPICLGLCVRPPRVHVIVERLRKIHRVLPPSGCDLANRWLLKALHIGAHLHTLEIAASVPPITRSTARSIRASAHGVPSTRIARLAIGRPEDRKNCGGHSWCPLIDRYFGDMLARVLTWVGGALALLFGVWLIMDLIANGIDAGRLPSVALAVGTFAGLILMWAAVAHRRRSSATDGASAVSGSNSGIVSTGDNAINIQTPPLDK